MLYDKETRHWQEEYRKGNLDDEDMPGEIRAILDGTAEKEMKSAIHIFLWALIPMAIMGIFGHIQARSPVAYAHLKDTLTSWGVALGTGYDPAVLFVLEVIAAIILFNIFRAVTREEKNSEGGD